MKVNYMVLADAAEALNGKHYILGGGFDTIRAPAFPVTHDRLSVALRIDVPWKATSQQHRLELDIVDADERSILPQRFELKFEAGRPAGMRSEDVHAVVLSFNFLNVRFESEGRYYVVCLLDGTEEGRQAVRLVATG